MAIRALRRIQEGRISPPGWTIRPAHLAGIVDDLIRTDGSDHADLGRAAHAGDVSAVGPGDLRGTGAHAARGAYDKYLLIRLETSVVAQALQGGQARDGNHRRLIEGEVYRSGRKLLLPSERILGEGALADAEHLIARLDPAHVLANRLHDPCEVHSGDGVLGRTEPERQSREVGQTGHQVPHAPVPTGRMHAHQRLVVAHLGLIELSEFQDIG